jgi:hypothetical protein
VYDVPRAPKQPVPTPRYYWLALILPLVALARYFFAFWALLFMNSEYMIGRNWAWGARPAIIAAILTACVTVGLAVWLYRRLRWLSNSRVYVAAGIGVAVWIGWVLFPYACDTHESWIDTPNKRCDCRGLTVRFYPGRIMDGAETEYCIGNEIF